MCWRSGPYSIRIVITTRQYVSNADCVPFSGATRWRYLQTLFRMFSQSNRIFRISRVMRSTKYQLCVTKTWQFDAQCRQSCECGPDRFVQRQWRPHKRVGRDYIVAWDRIRKWKWCRYAAPFPTIGTRSRASEWQPANGRKSHIQMPCVPNHVRKQRETDGSSATIACTQKQARIRMLFVQITVRLKIQPDATHEERATWRRIQMSETDVLHKILSNWFTQTTLDEHTSGRNEILLQILHIDIRTEEFAGPSFGV